MGRAGYRLCKRSMALKVVKSVQVLLINIYNISELLGLFVSLGDLLSFSGLWFTGEIQYPEWHFALKR